MELFRRTANSFEAVGLDARHGVEQNQPPSTPMDISEARSLITTLVHAWLTPVPVTEFCRRAARAGARTVTHRRTGGGRGHP
jgi:hypothetical protein